MRYNMEILAFITTVMVSAIFLIYTGDLYFKTYCLTHGVHVSIQTLNIEQGASGIFVENTVFLENPSSLSFKVTYIKEEIYNDPNFKVRLGSNHISGFSGSYIVLVRPFSNATVHLTVSIDEIPLNEKLFIVVYMRFDDIPILRSLYLTRYFGLPFNVSSGGIIH